MQTIEYNLSKQEHDYFCVPAVVQAILRRYKQEETQLSIAEQLGFKEGVGIDFGSNLKEFFSRRKLTFDFTSPNAVTLKIPELIIDNWIRKEGDLIIGYSLPNNHRHVFLTTSFSFTNKEITLLNPKDCLSHQENLEDLYDGMCQTNFGGFGLVKLL